MISRTAQRRPESSTNSRVEESGVYGAVGPFPLERPEAGVRESGTRGVVHIEEADECGLG
jgi:hypothetical protein